MREIEIKAHVKDAEALRKRIEAVSASGHGVSKRDTYLKNEKGALLRIRNNNGRLEATIKESRKNERGEEDNLEYELSLLSSEQESLAFFSALGYDLYFNKYKDGWDWTIDNVHVELLEVNDLGWFLELEALLPFTASDKDAEDMRELLHKLLSAFGIDEGAIEARSYRSMILGDEYGV